jgi:hypothetical protein
MCERENLSDDDYGFCKSYYHINKTARHDITEILLKKKDKTQVKQLRKSSPITYITKYAIKHYNIELHKFLVNIYSTEGAGLLLCVIFSQYRYP